MKLEYAINDGHEYEMLAEIMGEKPDTRPLVRNIMWNKWEERIPWVDDKRKLIKVDETKRFRKVYK